ncbi:major outer membrane protein [Aliarcobacter butzleri]|uniref:major outer membrane protein n=1 Tax=Aliarcobacter butzleri TaxID=28197 RepID=UPI0021B32938|nr:major outer membrane protein [Aliarcobacter butzleri]MCT7594642.1 major outer membrane protein [Aliarcobacter butzleri]MCT7599266.1 major outer membrane protein [Aliarcobacter butzleri]
MRKISKLSLVAAVAVAGFSTANAQPLEEAIKNVEVSGSVVYRYNDSNDEREVNGVKLNDKSNTNNNYKIGLNLSSKVNDYVKFNSRFLVSNPGLFSDNGFASLNTQTTGDASPEVRLSHANFAFTGIKNTTITAGKQGLTTPWTVAIDSDGGEQSGTGVLAITTVGPVSFAGAYFNQTNLDKSGDAITTLTAIQTINKNLGATDIATAGIIGNLEVVTLDAWYLNMKDVFDTYTVGAKSDFKFDGGKIGFDARYVYLDPAESLVKEQELAKIAVSGNVGIVNAKVAYAWTGKDGGTTAIDNDAETTLLGWNLNANSKTDADYWQLVLGVNVLDNLNLSANYGNIQWNPNATTEREQEEIYAQVTYKMSKNLSTYVRYGTFTDEQTVSGTKTKLYDGENVGRLQVEYTF